MEHSGPSAGTIEGIRMTTTDLRTADPSVTTDHRGYGGMWRTLLPGLAYLLVWFPIAAVGFGLTLGLFSSGVGMLAIFVGILLVIGALYVARGFGTLNLLFIGWAARRAIPAPEWMDRQASTGFGGWLRACLGNGHYWLYLLHVMVVDFIVTTVTWAITIAWVSVTLGGLTYWFWDLVFPDQTRWGLAEWVRTWPVAPSIDPQLLDFIVLTTLGLVFLATLPVVVRGLTTLHWWIARGMLGAFRSDALQREVAALAESRGAAISAEGTSLRRLERDIHDGPQQRLVRMQMDLAAAERQLADDPEKARELISEAMQQSRDALEELRALSRGFAPPILLDRGLVAALESAVARSNVPARLEDALPEGTELTADTERNAYFIASEALANAAKHSGATQIVVRVALADDGRLELAVSDDGAGGAAVVPGHGLAGLEERVRGLGGTIEVVSPVGGPTTVTARLPR